MRGRPKPLFLKPGIALSRQLLELFILLIDTRGDALFVAFAGCASRLFHQLPDIVLEDRNPVVEFGQRQRAFATHRAVSRKSPENSRQGETAPLPALSVPACYFAASSTET